MNLRFEKGEFVVYGKNGVCFIDDIRSMDFGSEKENYYVLKPKASNMSTLYVPVKNESLVSRMRPVITKEDIDALLEHARNNQIEWIEDKLKRQLYFNEISDEGNSKELLLFVCSMYMKKMEKLSAKKNFSSSDETMLKTAERLIEDEFAFSLMCSKERVVKYIKEKLEP